MAKRSLSILLAAAMILSIMVVPVGADSNITSTAETCPCGCAAALSALQWTPWNVNESGSPKSGHYYLAGDYIQAAQNTITSGSKVVLDLRGCTITTADYSRLLLIYGELYVIDTVGGGRMQCKTTGSSYGGVIMLSSQNAVPSLFQLHSGTLTVDDDNKSSARGGIVSISTNSTFRMYDGLICGGSAVTASDREAPNGGGIAAVAASATIEILGGTIMDCSSAANGGTIYSIGTTILKNCRILGGTAEGNGGNIYQYGGSLTMENCEVAYGTAKGTAGGGNIYVGNASGATGANITDNGSVIRDGAAILNGTSGGHGGNLYLGAGDHTFTGTTLRGGVGQKYGANVVCFSTAVSARLEDCTVSGDMRFAGELTLAGKTTIGMVSNGLNLSGSSATAVVDASELEDGAEIFVSANGVFAKAGANMNYFKPALRTVITQEADGTLKGTFAASGEEGGYCPHCYDPENPKKVTWTAFGSGVFIEGSDNQIVSGHYYLSHASSADPLTKRFHVNTAEQDVVIDLNSKSLASDHRVFVMGNGAKLTILDSLGGGSVTGIGNSGWSGGVIYGSTQYTLNIYGGRIIYAANTDKHINYGGAIYAAATSTVNIKGGTVDGSTYNSTTTDNYGGAIFLNNTANSFNMTAGRILGGNAYMGGALSFGKSNIVRITGGMISGGSTTNGGGNLRVGSSSGKASFEMKDCAVIGGASTGTKGGGNLCVDYSDAKFDNCYIIGGTSTGEVGGNLRVGASVSLTATDSIFANGTANKGGNLYTAATNSSSSFTSCLVLNGKATAGNGGNAFFNMGKNTVIGGTFAYGTATSAGGNIHTNAGNHATADQWTVIAADAANNIPAPKLFGGKAGTNGGNIHAIGILDLKDAHINHGNAATGKDIYLDNGATATLLTVGTGVAGNISFAAAEAQLSEPVYGKVIGDTASAGFAADIRLEGDYGNPSILAKDGALYVAAASVGQTWYADNASAVADCSTGEYVKLYTDNDLVLSKDCYVDLNGHAVKVSGSGKLYGMDSSGDDYSVGTGSATWEGAANTEAFISAPNGNKYMGLTEGTTATYHRLGMGITDIALRPSNAGLYYKASWSCDSVIAPLIAEHGIVVSTNDMPGENFRNEAEEGQLETTNNLWVSFDNTQLENGSSKCGVIIKNIFKDTNTAQDNAQRGEIPIYATAYITTTGGATYISDTPGGADDIAYSLHGFMDLADQLIESDPLAYHQIEMSLQEFYTDWLELGTGEWTFARLNIPEATGPLCDGRTLRILAITSSFGLNTTQLLYDIAKAEGCENVIVARLYASGCTLAQHDSNAKNNTGAYDYSKIESGTWVTRKNTTMEYGLVDEDWDIIFLQQSAASSPLVATYGDYIDSIMAYVQQTKTNPAARFVWNMTWAYQSDSTQSVFVNTFNSDQMAMYASILDAVQQKVVGRTDFSAIIPTGTAIQNARTSYFGDTLAKDTYHLNNLGRAIAGYTLWATLTGKPLTEVNLGPVNSYDLPEKLVLSETDRLVIIDAVNNAIAKPFEVTQSAYPEQ